MDNTSKQVEIDQFREKLLKLVNEAIDKRVPTLTFGERIADHLIANGVRSKENVQDVHDINVGNKLSGISGQLKWIPVTERLPEEYNPVLAWYGEGYFAECARWTGRRWETTWEHEDFTGVTHWMPLPTPPEGGLHDDGT